MGCPGPSPSPAGFVKATGPTARRGSTGQRTAGTGARGVRLAPVTAVPLGSRPRLRAVADRLGAAASPGRMGGEAGSAAAAAGSEGRVKSLGLVFEDERKGCYSSGETVAGHVLLEAAEPVALRALRLEAQGRATASWGSSAGAAAPAAASEVEYLNVCLSLREPPAGERRPRPGRGASGDGEGALRGMPAGQGAGGGGRFLGVGSARRVAQHPFGGCGGRATMPAHPHLTTPGRRFSSPPGAPPLPRWALSCIGVPGPPRQAVGVSRCHGNQDLGL